MKSYLRFLSRNKLYTAIEVVGLSVSLAFVIPLIGYYSNIHMISKGHDNYKNIYSMCYDGVQVSSPGFGDFLKERIPEIKKISSPILDNRPKIIENQVCKINYIDKEFFYFFPVKFIGGCADFIETPGQIAVSSKFAGHLSQSGPVIGRKISHENKDYTISAIFDNYGNGVLSYCDILMSNEKIKISKSNDFPFRIRGSLTIFSVTESSDRNDVTGKVRKAACEYWGGMDSKYREEDLYRLVRYDEMTTDSSAFIGISSNPKSVSIVLGIVFIFLFLIPILNYINLTTALTTRRAKEMAMRKLCGADNISIILKYCAESLIFTSICFAFGLILTKVTGPALDFTLQATGIGESGIQMHGDIRTILLLICTVCITSLISGLAPAMLASRFTALDVTKGIYRFHSKKILSKIFICFESLITVILIAVAISTEAEYRKKLDIDYNCNIEDVYILNPGVKPDKSIDKIKEALEQRPEVLKTGRIRGGYPGRTPLMEYRVPGEHSPSFLYSIIECDESTFDLLEFEILEDYGRAQKAGIWITDKAEDFFADYPGSFESIVNERGISLNDAAGKVKDYPSVSVNTKDYISANMISVSTDRCKRNGNLIIKTISDHNEARKAIAQVYEDVLGEKVTDIMRFGRVSNYIEDIHKEDLNPFFIYVKLFRYVMILAIFMTMMGLFGMSVYFMTERKQETAIRKAFGGTIYSETIRNTAMYMKLTSISCIMAIPVIYTFTHIAKRSIIRDVENTWWIYIVSISLSFIISLVSVLWQTLRAARTNPAEALKKE